MILSLMVKCIIKYKNDSMTDSVDKINYSLPHTDESLSGITLSICSESNI